MEAAPARIRLPIFEGPLDLLLHLVKIDEVEITEVRISDITRQYLEYLQAMQQLDLEIAGDFLVMAATLMNIKLRSILPAPPSDGDGSKEEEIDEILSTQDLVRRLVEYRRFKQLAMALREREEQQSGVFYRPAPVLPIHDDAAPELPQMDIRQLFDSFVKILSQVRSKPEHHVLEERFTMEDKLVQLRERMRADRHVNLRRVFEACVNKDELVCYFLAVLEMARLREITLAQSDTFEDILIEPWDEKVVYVG